MFKSYPEIFNQRGNLYHQGMQKYPLARQQEFHHILRLAEIQAGDVICDSPAGGCYLSNFIEPEVKIISIETSSEFIRHAQKQDNNVTLVCETLSELPLLAESLDRMISLAGLHHVDNKLGFYRESYRLLKAGGILAIADVQKGTGVAEFLNIFVDQYNSMGHQGDFFDKSTKDELENIGFKVTFNASISYHWQFDSLDNMIEYCQLLFGIDRADRTTILEGIKQYLGYHLRDNQYYLNWELCFFKAIK